MKYHDSKDKKPLSPHLGIYKPQISSVLSILHRISGIVNFVGLSALVWWIVCVTFSTSNPMEGMVWNFFTTAFGNLILMGWTLSVFFHACTGIRHLFWDAGMGFDVKTMTKTGLFAVGMAFTLTVITWLIIYNVV